MEKCEICSEEYKFQKRDYRDEEILMGEKMEIYEKTETPLINLYPSDLENLDKSLSFFL